MVLESSFINRQKQNYSASLIYRIRLSEEFCKGIKDDEEAHEGIFVNHPIRKLVIDETLKSVLNIIEKAVWKAFRRAVKEISGNKRIENYVRNLNEVPEKYCTIGCNAS